MADECETTEDALRRIANEAVRLRAERDEARAALAGSVAREQQLRDALDFQPANVDALCELMHNEYETAARREGWQTQERSRVAWTDVPAANQETMRSAVRALLGYLHGRALVAVPSPAVTPDDGGAPEPCPHCTSWREVEPQIFMCKRFLANMCPTVPVETTEDR